MNTPARLPTATDRGSVSLLAIALASAVLAMIGLSVDGGGKVAGDACK